MKKKDYINISLIAVFFFIVIFIITKGEFYYGSTLDWANQHFSLPEYIRTLFYDTFDLLPDYAFNLGSGQNIYYIAYYGLLSPIILISYFLPFIDMMDFIIASSILIVIFDIFLVYKWLKNNGFESKICFIATFLFICATPIIFHSHRHIMFVNYIPFLILGFMGVDKYFKTNKRWLLTLSIFLIIMTSYFYSVGSILSIVIYGVFHYLDRKKVTIKDFLKEGFKFLYPIIVGILMSLVLLLPIVYTLLNGRSQTTAMTLTELLTPDFSLTALFYNSYSMGLTCIGLIALLNSLFKEKKYKFMSITMILLLLIPIFNYLLNGTLYLNNKAFIPFIPIVIYLIAEMLKDIKKFHYKGVTISLAVMLILSFFFKETFQSYFYIDLFITLSLLICSKKNIRVMYILLILVGILVIETNLGDDLVKKGTFDTPNFNVADDSVYRSGSLVTSSENVNKVDDSDTYIATIYSSVFNKTYNKFYYDVFNNPISYRNRSLTTLTNNILFNNFMGIKYITSDYALGDDYELIEYQGNTGLYKSKNANTIGFVTYNTTSTEDYNKLDYPNTIYHIINSAVTDDVITNITSPIKKIDLNYEVIKSDVKYQLKKDIYKIKVINKNNIKLKTDLTDDQILFIRFDMLYSENCSVGDTIITINNQVNKLTCSSWKYHNQNYKFDYILYNNLDELNITLYEGNYEISNIEFYVVDKKSVNLENTPFNIDKSKTKGDNIVGSVNANNDGYFILTVPYDKGYNILVDGVKTEYSEVNSGLVGFKISKGLHNIKITYNAPYKKIGLAISIIGLILLILEIVRDKGVKMINASLKIYKKYKEIINYIIVGGLTTVVSLVSYFIFSRVFDIDNNYYFILANVLSWICAVTFAYIANKLFVFESKTKGHDTLKEIIKFILSRISTFFVDLLIMYILVKLIKVPNDISKIIVQFIIVVLNYILSKIIVFKHKS